MKRLIYPTGMVVFLLIMLPALSRATWTPGMNCSYGIAYSVTTATRDNRGIALSLDGQYLYLGYNNGPDFRRIQLSNGAYLNGNTTDRAKNIAVDDQGRVYTTGPDGNPIKIYNSTLTAVIHTIPMTKCEGIAVRRESGSLYLYATDRNDGTLSRFLLTENAGNVTAHTLSGLDGDGVVTITGGSGIRGVAVGADGKILVANPGTGVISKLNANGSGQVDYNYSASDNPYYFTFINGQLFVTHGNYLGGTRVSVINYSDMTLVGNIVPPFAALGLKTTDATDMISGISPFIDNTGFYITYEDGSAANDSYKEPVIKVTFNTVHNLTQNTWFATIQPAIDAASAGDIIEVDAGTYAMGATQLNINKSVTIRAKAGLAAKPKITTSYTSFSYCAVRIAANNVVFDGFEIDGSSAFSTFPSATSTYLIGDYNSTTNIGYNGWTVKNCYLHHGREGLRLSSDNNVTIESNEIAQTVKHCIDCGNGLCYGLKVTKNWLHSEQLAFGAKPAGIYYFCDHTAGNNVEFSYNYCTACRTFCDFAKTANGDAPSNDILIMHNTVDWNLSALPSSVTASDNGQMMGIAFWAQDGSSSSPTQKWNSSHFIIRDNIFSRTKWYGVVATPDNWDPLSGPLDLKNNLFFQWYKCDAYYVPANICYNEWPGARGAVGWGNFGSGNGFSFTNNIQSNPLFAASGTTPSSYYALASGSPARGTASDGTEIGAWQSAVVWTGAVSSDWNTAGNWTGNAVPPADASIGFDNAPSHHCQLDQNRTVSYISNAQSTYRIVTNGHKLTIKGALNLTNGAQIDASSANSVVEFAGTATQSIPSGAFLNNEVYTLTTNNLNNIVLNGTLRVLFSLIPTNGRLDANTASPTVVYAGTAAQLIMANRFLNEKAYNLTIDNAAGVTLNTDFTVSNTLVVNSGKLFTIAAGKKLEVQGTISNSAGSAGFILQSNENGTAAMLHSTNFVHVTVQRYFSGTTQAWHFVSSPVSDQTISGAWTPLGYYANGTGYDLYYWNEPTTKWIYKLDSTSAVNWHTVHPGNLFIPGRGYLYSFQNPTPTKEFVGTLNNGPLSLSLTRGGPDPIMIGFNMVGNPYPSPIDWQASSGWGRSGLVSSGGGYDIWIWNPAASNYGICNSVPGSVGTNSVTRYIAPMQGFFVQSTGSATLSMDNPVRVLNTSTWFKDIAQADTRIRLSVTSDDGFGFDEIQLGFGFATNENGARKLFSSEPTAPSLFVAKPADNYSVLYYTNTKENPSVPVNFTPGANGNYTITCNFDQSIFDSVFLEDRHLHSSHNMKVLNTYHFQSLKADSSERFVLHFGTRESFPNTGLPAKIYPDGTHLVVDLLMVEKETEVSVYDVMGRLLFQQIMPGKSQHSLDLNSSTQLLIFYLKNADGTLRHKMVWGNNNF